MSQSLSIQNMLDGDRMIDARTTKVLGSLLAAMTVGALLLMALECDPPQTDPAGNLAAIRAAGLDQQIKMSRSWRRIVVHSSSDAGDTLPQRCHFVVETDSNGQPSIRVNSLWKKQQPGHHIYVPGHDFNADSIGICLMGDFSVDSPTKMQFETLMSLVRRLQQAGTIPADSVYLQCELNPTRQLPGKAFPAKLFNARLYRPGV